MNADGPGEDGRPGLVLVHGAGQGARMWRHQVAPLSDRYRILAPDLPGYGGAPGPFSLAAAVTAVRRILEADGAAHLCGISLGGVVAARVAGRHPELVRRLILSAPAIAPARTHPRTLRRYRRWPGWLVRRITDLPDRRGWLAVVDELAGTDISADLPRITAPTLVLSGRRDRPSLADARRAAAAGPGARLLVVPHVGHLFPLTAPRVFNTIAAGFLGS